MLYSVKLQFLSVFREITVAEITAITSLLRSISELLMKENRDVLKLKPGFVIIFLMWRSTHEGPAIQSLSGSPPRRFRPRRHRGLAQAHNFSSAAEPIPQTIAKH